MARTVETVPTSWSATDALFFRDVAAVFPPAFLCGATVLLASYDPEPDAAPAAAASRLSVAEPSAANPVAPEAPGRARLGG
jgi:hypothetical protein